MKEIYNQQRIQELLDELGFSRTRWRKQLNIQDDRLAKKYLAGGDMHVKRLLQIADLLGVSVAQFFLRDGIRLDRAIATDAGLMESENVKTLRMELDHTKELMDVKMAYERRIGELTKEVELLQKELDQLKRNPTAHHPLSYIEKERVTKEFPAFAAESNGL